MDYESFIKQIHRRLAIISVGGSAIRNQGAAGLVDIAREYFENSISLDRFFSSMKDDVSYRQFLDLHTEKLVDKFPIRGKSWGAARKGLNLFFRDLVYNKFIADKYGLAEDFEQYNDMIKHLEVPLDSFVAKGLIDMAKTPLPKWVSIKELTPIKSDQFQTVALQIAEDLKMARVHLDLILCRQPVEAAVERF